MFLADDDASAEACAVRSARGSTSVHAVRAVDAATKQELTNVEARNEPSLDTHHRGLAGCGMSRAMGSVYLGESEPSLLSAHRDRGDGLARSQLADRGEDLKPVRGKRGRD
jgi:hypothetical protein